MQAATIRAAVRDAATGSSPWDPIPAERLAAIGRRCGEAEIAEVIAVLDELSAEREALPDWDGDSSDDIAKAQSSYASILGHVPGPRLPAVVVGLASASADTRRWLTLALEAHGAAALPALRGARDAERDPATRQFMTAAVGRLEAATA
jgi:hypothetical protein